MQQPSTFQVYNASAGSGKTFTLVKEYLKVILTSDDIFTFQKILAITFTNKAAGEMKERVLSNLENFSDGIENDLLHLIIREIEVDKLVIQNRSRRILDAILQNYSAFAITTIDSFTHKIIKNFAYDLDLPLNFEVELDSDSLLNQAVEILISKIGSDKELTNLLINYSLDKIDDDKSWDITNDLNDFAKVLLKEDDIPHFKNLSKNSLEDFINLKKKLIIEEQELKSSFKKVGESFLKILEENNLEFNDFNRGSIPKFFSDIATKSFDFSFTTRSETIAKAIESHQYYKKATTNDVASTIENIVPVIIDSFQKSKTLYGKYLLNNLILKNIIPLAVLNKVNEELSQIKEDNNIQLNAEFNQLISENIKEQPAPFIYERIGQRFQYYFIDEMQDTSVLQWQNLIPLIDNSLAQENGKLMLVGDGKQAIYRWRGGKAEQFIGLSTERQEPFQINKEVKNLEINYRSYSEVVNFNNQFFQHTSNFLQNESYKKLFVDGNKQLENTKKGGYVSLSFLEEEKDKEEKKLQYPKKIYEKIRTLQGQFSLSEICVLVRKRKDGVAVANYLSENGIEIISSETLLLQNSSKVNFIVNVLKLIQNQNDEETSFDFLYFLHNHFKISDSKHDFFKKFAKKSFSLVLDELKEYQAELNINNFYQLPFYEKIEEIIRAFNLIDSSDAYVQFFLDVVLEQQRKGVDVNQFLDFWEHKKEKLSIVAPESANAVQIMTIHKSKGLEFPVVIFPYDLDIYREMKPKIWYDDLKEDFNNFKEFYIDYNKNLQFVGARGQEIFNQRREELELDNFNLLYVALTRAIEQLHIIKEIKLSRGQEDVKFYSGILINFLKSKNKWQEGVFEYSFGEIERVSNKVKKPSLAETQEEFISNQWKEHNIVLLASASKLWNTEQGKAIDYGNLLHEIMANIYTYNDIEEVVLLFKNKGLINDEQSKYLQNQIEKVVEHVDVKEYFLANSTVYNEREIVDVDNQIIIPDRLVFNQYNEVSIIDYKTGKPLSSHHQQLMKYERVLKSMGFKINKKILIYINDKIDVIEV